GRLGGGPGGSGEAARPHGGKPQGRGAPRGFSPGRKGQAREQGRRPPRDHPRRDACTGGQPVRDLEETSERGEHLNRLAVIVGVPTPGGNKDEAFCERTSAHVSLEVADWPVLRRGKTQRREPERRTPAALAPQEDIRDNDH